MSCQALQHREQYDHQAMNRFPSSTPMQGDSINSFADVQSAFNKSDTMKHFESQMKYKNPLYENSEKMSHHYDEQLETINANLENYLKNVSDESDESSQINFPLTRNQYYSPTQTGTELLEGYDVIENIQQGYTDMDEAIAKCTGMNIYKWILILLLLAIFVYALYCVCHSPSVSSGRRENLRALESQVKNLMDSNTRLFSGY